MKILLLGEYSNVHNTLAQGLRSIGQEVCVASDGDDWKNYPRDIDLYRNPSRRLNFAGRLLKALPKMRGYDIVQIINPMFLELKAEHIFSIYKYLRRHNGKIVLGAFGMDYYWVSINSNIRPLRYSDFNFGETIRTDPEAEIHRKEWIGTTKERLNRMIAGDCDGIVAGLYEYWATYREITDVGRNGKPIRDKMTFIPFPIVLPDRPNLLFSGGPVRLFVGISRNRSAYKGTDIMLRAARDVRSVHPKKVEINIAEGVSFEQYNKMMDGSDAILDQLYSYTPSMNSLLAMSKGIINIGGGEPENYSILGENNLRPIVNVKPNYDSVYSKIEELITSPEAIPELKRQSVEYIRRHHDYIKVASEYLDFYNSI